MADHAHYIQAVADHLDEADFYVMSVSCTDWPPRMGYIRLGCQDGWDHYDWGDLDLSWDDRTGWNAKWGGLTDDLGLPGVAPPWRIAMTVGVHVGQATDFEIGDDRGSDVTPGTAEFEAALATYEPKEAA